MTYGNCNKCVFWRDIFGERFKAPASQRGSCRAHAPVMIQTTTIGLAIKQWPETTGGDGCGDFQETTK